MILHTLPTWLTAEGALALPRHARLPLGLAQNSKLWALYRRRQHDFDQVMLSPYSPKKWADLWRLDMQMRDASGQLLELIQILDACKIRVLHQASRNAFSASYHFKYLVLDCTKYVSPIDGNSEQRAKGEAGLTGLRDLLLLRFLPVLRISTEGEPKLRIERNLVHFNMHQALENRTSDSDRVEVPLELRMERNTVPLGRLSWLAGPLHRDGRRYAVISTNTKSHVIYCRLTYEGSERMSHLAIFFEGRGDILQIILAAIKKLNLNIVRSQLKQDLLSSINSYPDYVGRWKRPFTLNVYVEAMRGFPYDPIDQHLAKIFQKDALVRDSVFVKPLSPCDPEVAHG